MTAQRFFGQACPVLPVAWILGVIVLNQELDRSTAADAAARVTVQLGTLQGQTLAIVVQRWDRMTRNFLERLAEQERAQLQIYAPGVDLPSDLGVTAASASEALQDASQEGESSSDGEA